MNHNPSEDSANVPSSAQAVVAGVRVREASARAEVSGTEYHLNPSLQQALGCLDIKLEDELTRFRSKQEHQSGAGSKPDVQSAQVSEATWEQESADFDASAEIFTAEIVRSKVPIAKEAVSKGGFIVIDGLTTSTTNSRSAITTNYAPIALHRPEVPAIQESLGLNFSSGGEIAPFHDEYLSSSQELLRQIQSGHPTGKADSFDNRNQSAPLTPKRNYLAPIAIGSMAAACVLAGGATYTYFNPSILASLTATKTVAPATTASALGQSIQSPNLAANEFSDLSLSTLNTIKLPATAAPTTNVSMATTSTMSGTATPPVAIPFNGMGTQTLPSATITSQPRLADSLVKSLLPPNFQSYIRPSGDRATSPGMSR